jgi:hypothetical protein
MLKSSGLLGLWIVVKEENLDIRTTLRLLSLRRDIPGVIEFALYRRRLLEAVKFLVQGCDGRRDHGPCA